MKDQIANIGKVQLEFEKEEHLEDTIKTIGKMITKFKRNKKVSMLDLLHVNIATNKLLMDQIIQMNTMIDESFDPNTHPSELLDSCLEYSSLCMMLKSMNNFSNIDEVNELSDKDLIKNIFGIEDEKLLDEMLISDEAPELLRQIREDLNKSK